LGCIPLRIRSKFRSMVGRLEPVHCFVKSELGFGRIFLGTTGIKIGERVVSFQRSGKGKAEVNEAAPGRSTGGADGGVARLCKCEYIGYRISARSGLVLRN
jgi:hypothetical protein